FVKYPYHENPNNVEGESANAGPIGARLIAKSDCKTCHNEKVKTIGPSYVSISERYPNNDASIKMLAGKIIKGGTGVWGNQVMSAHPNLPVNQAEEMVEYILDLVPDGEVATTSASNIPTMLPDSSVNAEAMIPGAFVEVYNINDIGVIPPKPVRNPNQAGVKSSFGNMNGPDFTGFNDNFAMYIDGYLKVEKEGEYIIRLWSDDGSRFKLNGKEIIEFDGYHGTESRETIVNLKEGYYPFNLKFFQGLGGKFLSLNWKKPGDSAFEVIPAANYYHSIDQQKYYPGISLEMSNVKRTPGDGLELKEVHPSYTLNQARPYDFLPKVGGLDFMPDGRLVVCTWDPAGAVYLVSDHKNPNPQDIKVKKIASGLAEPLGIKVVDNKIYVLQKQELTELVDNNGDDIIDEYNTISNQWRTSANFHEFAFGLDYKDGFFYATLATAIEPGGASTNPQIPDRGKVAKINRATGEVEFIAHGLRTPNGIGRGVDGELFVADNQGDWLPSSKIVHVKEDAWYGSRSVDFVGTANLKETKPVVWLPQDEIGNSPSTPSYINDGPYKGQMIHGEVTHGGVKRVFVEKVNGEYQGAVFRFIQGLEAGVNRIVWSPDGELYVGGIGNPGNWAQSRKLWYGLQRLKYNEKSTFEMLAVRAKSNGIEIEFTEPLKEGDGWNKSDYEIKQWQYVPTINYGGPKVGEKDLNILSVNVSEDRKRVFLELQGMQEDRVVYVHLLKQFVSAAGNQMWSTEAWYTMNSIPATPGSKTQPSANYANNTLTPTEAAEGWELLFDGKTTNGWRNFRKQSIGSSWVVKDGAISLASIKKEDGAWQAKDGGDIITDKPYENFELNLEWKISNCGNSGIIYSVVESDEYDYVWQTGPEMQILDNTCHPDTRYPTHRAGDLYDMIECKYVTVKPAGQWNQIRLIKKDGHVEHWQNGVKVVEFDMYNDQWNKMIANSKFKDMKGFGLAKSGHISLQDHGDPVSFRNIKIKRL
ncbi:MAG: family 16 glycoside hydrolase, partial [Bacteroidota bacterium]